MYYNINRNSRIKDIKVWNVDKYYEHQLKPSVAKYLFEDIFMVENIAPEGNSNRP